MTGFFTYRNFSLDDTPSLEGKVAAITGGQGGIGKEITAQLLIHKVDKIFVLARNEDKFLQAQEEWRCHRSIILKKGNVRVEFVKCDLTDIFAVEKAAKFIKQSTDRLDILICNAGAGVATDYKRSPQHIEAVFAANCVGHQILTMLLLPLLRQTVSGSQPSSAKVVVTSSSLHYLCRELNVDLLTSPVPPKHKYINGIWRYARSKLGNILFTKELSRRLLHDEDPASSRIYVNTFFPGNIVTDQWMAWDEYFGSLLGAISRFLFRIVGQNKEDGAATAIYLAASPEIAANDIRGQYFIPIATKDTPAGISGDMELAQTTWEWIDAKAIETLGPSWQESS